MKNLLEQLQQLAPLAAAATTGPWDYGSSMELSQHEVTQTFVFQDSKVSDDDEWNNAAFIAAARNLLTPENLALLVAALAGSAVVELESKLLEMLRAVEPHDYWSRGRAVGISDALTLVRNHRNPQRAK